MALADAVAFFAANGGTGAFGFGQPADSYRTPVQALNDGDIVNGGVYSYFAQSPFSTPTQREWGEMTYNSVTNSFTRLPVGGINNGSDTGTSPVNFGEAPFVAISALVPDFGGSLVVGVTPVTGGVSGNVLTDNGGVVGTSPARTILTGDTNYYVATTGSDSNPGTIGSPWATPQHAADFIALRIDQAVVNITVNIGAGIFVGPFAHGGIGGGNTLYLGAGSANTTLKNSSLSGNIANFASSATYFCGIDSVAFDLSGADGFVVSVTGGTVWVGNFFTFTGDIKIFSSTPVGRGQGFTTQGPGCLIFLAATIVIDATNITLFHAVVQPQLQGQIQDFCTCSVINGPLNVSSGTAGYFEARFDGVYLNSGATHSGAVTGQRYVLSDGSSAGQIGATIGPTFFPGTIDGTSDSSSSYDGVSGSNDNYQTPANAFMLTLNNIDTQVILDPAAGLATGTITMAPAPINGQVVEIRTSQTITTLTINGNVGQTIAGYSAGTLAAGGRLTAVYRAANTTWYF